MLSSFREGSAAAKIAERFSGNDDVVALLGGMIDEGRLPHAFIIEGDDGLGKSTLARIIAEGAMCECREKLSGECSHCRKLRADIHPDLIFVQGSGKTNAIAIDTIRDMRRDSLIAPNEAKRRVFLLEDCDNMQPTSQNAFLKIFEEAPPHIIFIITCKSAMNLLTTIRSRGTLLTLHPVSLDETTKVICRRHGELSENRAEEAAKMSGGNIGAALKLLEVGEVRELTDRVLLTVNKIMQAAAFGSELELAAACAEIGRDRNFANEICLRLLSEVRGSLMVSVGAADTLNSPTQAVSRFGSVRSAECLMKCLKDLSELKDSLRINVSMPLFNTKLAIILQRR